MSKLDSSPIQHTCPLPPISPTSTKKNGEDATSTPPRKRLGLSSGLEKTGVKKLTLKSKPKATSTPQDASAWTTQAIATLSRAVRAIQSRPPQPTPESLEALYSLCEGAVGRGQGTGQILHDRLRMEIERNALEVKRELLKLDVVLGEEEIWLGVLEVEWKGFLERMLLVRSIFLHLDRTFVLQSAGLLSIWDLGLDTFRHNVIEDELVATRMTSSLLALVIRERNGDLVSRPLLRSLIIQLRALSAQPHSTLFVTPFLAGSRYYFKEEGNRLSAELDSSSYLRRVEDRLVKEGERCDTVLGSDLKGSILRVVLEEMVSGHVEAIVTKDLPNMVKELRTTDLTSLYTLLGRVGAIPTLRAAYLAHLKDAGLAIVMDKAQDDKMIETLISFRKSMLSLVAGSFGHDPSFTQAVSHAFEFFVNKRENKPAEMMAKYLDAKLRSGNRSMDDAELEENLKQVLYLFRFTQGKDIFEAFYKRDLAKRLLLNKSASFDAERSMLLKLKDECGPGFTQKLEIMFKDIELSSDFARVYSTSRAASTTSLNLSVNILSMGNWPSYSPSNVRLPGSMALALDKFKEFYVSKHSGRSLQWQHSLDTCALKAQFPKGGKKELAVSLFQAIILLLFNDVPEGGSLSFEEIKEGTRIEDKELARTLQSLACGKVRVLQKTPKGRDVNPGDQFNFNKDFKDDHIKIRINQIQQKETEEENKSTTDRVFTDRASHLQLAIVRIMKARKTIKYSELVMEVVSQIGTRFKVETSEIKKNISSLIDRDYLRRAEGQQNVFEYVA
ncbi:Cullin-domain-containing protein [Meredithblackwellia eburnea MCA 4105]